MRPLPFVALALSIATAVAAPLAAQPAGVILDPAGRPIAEASVVLWSASRELARATTDPSGRFRFTTEQATGATALLARRIGLQPLSRALTSADTALRLVLEPIPAPLPQVTATAVRRACPGDDEPEARALWRAVASRYVTAPLDRAHATLMWLREGEVPAAEVAEIDERRLRDAWLGVAGAVRTGWARILTESGYAARQRKYRSGFEPGGTKSMHWRYVPLHRELVDHFVSDEFARGHALRVWHHDDGSVTVAFCRPRHGPEATRPTVEGTLELAPDSSIASASWRYITPRPHEDAGGNVVFVAPPAHARFRRLVPARSVFWRRLSGSDDLYFQDAAIYRTWRYGEDGQLMEQLPEERLGAP